ncbi:hypothetical protein GCM10010517_02800 [Streptosporangium fragile]|uniref:Uncharacterized protein n=1 Tax=Streptosporangium fragile TaxID=46186 RepID=A0ABP6I7S7_9ACTN
MRQFVKQNDNPRECCLPEDHERAVLTPYHRSPIRQDARTEQDGGQARGYHDGDGDMRDRMQGPADVMRTETGKRRLGQE